MAKAPTAIGSEIGKQISAKSMGFDKETLLDMVVGDKTVDHFLYRVVGVATALKPYKSRQKNDDGELMTGFGLLGSFEATSVNGEVRKGSKLFLPNYVQDMIIAILSMPDVEGAKIGFDIYARYDRDSATSYIFIARDLLNESAQSVDEVKMEIKALPMPGATLALPKE